MINFRQDPIRQEPPVSPYGEVQKEVIGATFADDDVPVTFRTDDHAVHRAPSRLWGGGRADRRRPNPFLATIGLRVDPVPVAAGVSFALEVELGAMPIAFFRAVEETVRQTLGQGSTAGRCPTAGWR